MALSARPEVPEDSTSRGLEFRPGLTSLILPWLQRASLPGAHRAGRGHPSHSFWRPYVPPVGAKQLFPWTPALRRDSVGSWGPLLGCPWA